MLEERDTKIRELEETIKILQEKLVACDISEKSTINEKNTDVIENDKPANVQTFNESGQENNSEHEKEFEDNHSQ